jgi:hypothetical protein
VTVVTTLVCFFHLHARLRARRAPGIPCALCLRRNHAARTRNYIHANQRVAGMRARLQAPRSNPSLRRAMDCFAYVRNDDSVVIVRHSRTKYGVAYARLCREYTPTTSRHRQRRGHQHVRVKNASTFADHLAVLIPIRCGLWLGRQQMDALAAYAGSLRLKWRFL